MFIKWIFNIGVPLLIWLLLPVTGEGGITQEIKTFLVITCAAVMMFALENINYFIPSLLLPFVYVLFNVTDAATAFRPWVQDTVWMALCVFILGNSLMRTGLLPRITYWCVIKLGGTYKGMVWGFTIAGMIACLLVAGANSLVLPLGFIIFGIVEALGLKEKKAATGLFSAGIFGVCTTEYFIYSANNISVMFDSTSSITIEPNYVEFFLSNLIFVPLLLLMPVMIIKFMKPDEEFEGLEYFKQKRAELGPMTKDEKKIACILAVMLIYLFTVFFHGLSLSYGFILAVVLCYIPGINVGKMEDITTANYARTVFLATCICIGTVAGSLGLGDIIVNMVGPYMRGVHPIVLIMLVFLMAFAVNFVLTPLAAMGAFAMPLAEIAVSLGVNPMVIFCAFFQGVDNVILPYERSVIAAIYSFGGMALKDFAKINAIRSLFCLIYLLVLGVPFWMLTGVFYS